ncbi:unnamed protein product, partial [Bubo scandiacus]
APMTNSWPSHMCCIPHRSSCWSEELEESIHVGELFFVIVFNMVSISNLLFKSSKIFLGTDLFCFFIFKRCCYSGLVLNDPFLNCWQYPWIRIWKTAGFLMGITDVRAFA